MKSKVASKKIEQVRSVLEQLKSGGNPRAKELGQKIQDDLFNNAELTTEFLVEYQKGEEKQKAIDYVGFLKSRVQNTTQQIAEIEKTPPQDVPADELANMIKYMKLQNAIDQATLDQDELFQVVIETLAVAVGYTDWIIQAIDQDDDLANLEAQFGENIVEKAIDMSNEQGIEFEEALKAIVGETGGNINNPADSLPNTTETPFKKDSTTSIQEKWKNRKQA